MPNRIIRDGILSSENVDALDFAEEVFYRRLQSVADDHGRFYANPKLIRAACYPLRLDRVSDSAITGWMRACEAAGLLDIYVGDDGKKYLQIIKFGQRIQSRSKFPDPSKEVVHREPPCATVKNRLVGGVVEDGVVGEGVITTANAVVVETPVSTARVPVQKIIELYHETLPELPRMAKLTAARRGQIEQRAREDLKTLDDWRAYFTDVRGSPFLMGRAPPSSGHPRPFRASLPWLTKAENFAKVREGNYHQ